MEEGIILVNKESGRTSRFVDNYLSKKFRFLKCGHLGTLDPFADGLLVIAFNKATKALPFLQNEPKEYLATLTLGSKTSSGDLDGEIIERREIKEFKKENILAVFSSFAPSYFQIPPMASALKKDGVPLYRYYRKSMTIERKPREAKIYKLELCSFSKSEIVFKSSVGSGTYIRTLAEDIAERLGNLGYLKSLKRLKIGSFDVSKSKRMEDIKEEDVLKIEELPFAFPKFEIDETMTEKAKNGCKMKLDSEAPELLLTHKGKIIAVYERREDLYCSKRGLF